MARRPLITLLTARGQPLSSTLYLLLLFEVAPRFDKQSQAASSVVRTAPPALAPCKGSPLIISYAVVIPLSRNSTIRPSTSRAPALILVSPCYEISAQGSRISAFSSWRLNAASVPFAVDHSVDANYSFRQVVTNVHHELNTITSESNQYCLFVRGVWTSSN